MEAVLSELDDEIPAAELSFKVGTTDENDIMLSEWVHVQSQQFVLLIWWLPTIMGILMGEMSLLFLSLCHIPQFLVYTYLSRIMSENRPQHENHYHVGDENFGSPCLETMVVWYLTIFMFLHHILRRISKGGTITRVNLRAMGYTLLVSSIFVSWAVVYTENNTLEQMIFGALLGCVMGSLSALYLEYIWSNYIPYLMDFPPFNWFGYVDSVYGNNTKCNCRSKMCRHRAGKLFFKYVSTVYSDNDSKSSQSSSYWSSSSSSNYYDDENNIII